MPTSSIIDNRDSNTFLSGLAAMSAGGTEFRFATALFSLDALLLLADTLTGCERVPILFGDDANAELRYPPRNRIRGHASEKALSF